MPLTKDQIQNSPRLPVCHTGRYKDRYYYKGILWLGPTNMIGHGPCVLAEVSHTTAGLLPIAGRK